MHRARIIRASLTAIAALTALPSATAAAGVICHISDESAIDAVGAVSPLFDDGRRHALEVGGALKVDGTEVEGYVAFTFDDGPKHSTTPRVLAALLKYDVPATFFVVGHRLRGKSENIRKNVATLRETIADGFLVGNHTVNHLALAGVKLERARDEITDNVRIVGGVLGYRPFLFRPPYGSNNAGVRKLLDSARYTEVLWSIDTKDYVPGQQKTLRSRTVAAVLKHEGGVVLMHDTKQATANAIAGILDDLEAANCKRLAAGGKPIVPVSLHYFLREADETARPIPEAVAARTEAYLAALPDRCSAREKPRPDPR